MISPDTDVFVLCVALIASLIDSSKLQIVVDLHIKKRRQISVNKCIEVLGLDHAAALLGFHAFSGCDQIGKMSTITKKKSVKAFLNLSKDHMVLETFQKLGESHDRELFSRQLELFTMMLYSCSHDESVNTIGELRCWTAERLPPTWGSLSNQIRRSNCMAVTWNTSISEFNPELPDPKDHGWSLIDGCLVADTTAELPAPMATIEMSVCKCASGKTKCLSGNCKCHKNGVKCSDMCKCKNCENTDELSIVNGDDD